MFVCVCVCVCVCRCLCVRACVWCMHVCVIVMLIGVYHLSILSDYTVSEINV